MGRSHVGTAARWTLFDLGRCLVGDECEHGCGRPIVRMRAVKLAGFNRLADVGPVPGTGVVTGSQFFLSTWRHLASFSVSGELTPFFVALLR